MKRPANRKPLPQPRTEGERLFRIATEGKSADKVARSLAVRHRALIAAWLNGERRPAVENRATIYAVYNVPVEAWDYRPGAAAPPTDALGPLTTAERPAPPAADLAAVTPPAAAANGNGHTHAAEGPTPTALEDCMSMLATVRAQLAVANLAPSQAIKLADAKTKLIVLRARLERDAERSEDRIVREHPAWKRLARRIVKVLAKHPAALKDLAAELGATLDEQSIEPGQLAADTTGHDADPSTQPGAPRSNHLVSSQKA